MIEFQQNAPIYIQIIDSIKNMILSEQMPAGSKVPSVRELAIKFKVNPNTMQRALSELERDGLMYTERTSGRFVTNDKETIEKTRMSSAKKIVDDFLTDIKSLGLSSQEIINLIERENN